MYQDHFPFRYAERIDYKLILMEQIQFIHQGLQVGNTQIVMNGILSLQILLYPMLDQATKEQLEKLVQERGLEIEQLSKIEPAKRTYERHSDLDMPQLIFQKRFELEQEKYQLLLTFAKAKDLLIQEVETEEL